MQPLKLATIALTATLATPFLTAPAQAAPARPTTLLVGPGQSIQAALDAARPGDTVLVSPGTYRENLEIATDGVTLVGDNAVLEPPDVTGLRRCASALGLTENPFGLCVTGTLINGLPPTVVRPVRNVTIRGMIVHRFPSTGIFTLGADNVRLDNVQSAGGEEYGVLLSHTTGGTIIGSHITGGDEAGIYVGDSREGPTTITDTDVAHSGIFAIFIRNSSNGLISRNRLTSSCVGLGFIPTSPETDAVADWLAVRNDISDNTGACPPGDEGGPTLSGTGVLLTGATRISVIANTITGNRPPAGTTPEWSGGVVLATGSVFGGPAVPTHNRILGNTLLGNQAYDINVVVGGPGNRILGNRCRTSAPAGLC